MTPLAVCGGTARCTAPKPAPTVGAVLRPPLHEGAPLCGPPARLPQAAGSGVGRRAGREGRGGGFAKRPLGCPPREVFLAAHMRLFLLVDTVFFALFGRGHAAAAAALVAAGATLISHPISQNKRRGWCASFRAPFCLSAALHAHVRVPGVGWGEGEKGVRGAVQNLLREVDSTRAARRSMPQRVGMGGHRSQATRFHHQPGGLWVWGVHAGALAGVPSVSTTAALVALKRAWFRYCNTRTLTTHCASSALLGGAVWVWVWQRILT